MLDWNDVDRFVCREKKLDYLVAVNYITLCTESLKATLCAHLKPMLTVIFNQSYCQERTLILDDCVKPWITFNESEFILYQRMEATVWLKLGKKCNCN